LANSWNWNKQTSNSYFAYERKILPVLNYSQIWNFLVLTLLFIVLFKTKQGDYYRTKCFALIQVKIKWIYFFNFETISNPNSVISRSYLGKAIYILSCTFPLYNVLILLYVTYVIGRIIVNWIRKGDFNFHLLKIARSICELKQGMIYSQKKFVLKCILSIGNR
jgi:hypothetical protein